VRRMSSSYSNIFDVFAQSEGNIYANKTMGNFFQVFFLKSFIAFCSYIPWKTTIFKRTLEKCLHDLRHTYRCNWHENKSLVCWKMLWCSFLRTPTWTWFAAWFHVYTEAVNFPALILVGRYLNWWQVTLGAILNAFYLQ